MASPHFLCIGAQKAGTTWLHQVLNSHESIWLPPVKEIQFLNEYYIPEAFTWTSDHRKRHAEADIRRIAQADTMDINRLRACVHILSEYVSYEWYEQLFDFAPENSIRGEMTPEYSLLPVKAIDEIIIRYSNLKVIFIMREPADRAVSAIKMRLNRDPIFFQGEAEKSAAIMKWATEWDIIERGNYQRIISEWGSRLPAGNLLTLLSDELSLYPERCITEVCSFLGIKQGACTFNLHKKIHVGEKISLSDDAKEAIAQGQASNAEWYKNNKRRFSVAPSD